MSFWRSTDAQYSGLAKLLHWGSALVIFGLFGLGLWMVTLDYYHTWYQRGPRWHMGVGVLLAIVIVLRLLYRAFVPYPPSIASHARWEKLAAKTVHLLLYLLLFVMFITGYLIETAKGKALPVFDWFEIPSVLSGVPNLEDRAGDIHEWVAYSIIALVALHALGALKHHLLDRDATLRRMLTRARKP